jgi:hypothetical protein
MTGFDKRLLAVSRWRPAGARLVDTYTAVIFRKSIVRKKWILLLAILESCAPTHRHFESPDMRASGAILAGILVKLLLFTITLAVSILLFLPAHAFQNTRPARRELPGGLRGGTEYSWRVERRD